jgi:chemotaxis protein MotA
MTNEPVDMTRPPLKRRIDVGSVIGMPAAVIVVLMAHVLEGGNARSLWQPAAALVVLGGTLAALCVSYPLGALFDALGAIWHAFGHQLPEMERVVAELTEYAQRARRKGTAVLENDLEDISDLFVRDALTLAVDGAKAETARQVLEIDRAVRRERFENAADVLETAAGYTPTLGILGAVLGLIHVMEHLTEPARLGSGIAVAFVATIYGVATANLLLLPLATKLRGFAHAEAQRRDVVIEAVVAIQEGLSPRFIEQKLRGYLGPVQRASADGHTGQAA